MTASSRAREAFFSSLSRELRWSLDHDGRFLMLEGAWQSVLGWQPEQLHGWRWEEIVHPADHAGVAAAIQRLGMGGGCERGIELRLAVPGGGHRPMSWTLVAGAGEDHILGLGHDLPEEIDSGLARRNVQLAARVADLEARYTAVERFAAVAAHQLSEPLIVAESSAIMLSEELEDQLDPTLRDRLDAIGRSAARTRRLIDALLAEARAADRPPKLQTVDAATVLEETLATLRPRMADRRATVVTKGLPVFQTEPKLLAIIFENLLSNAIKYGPRTGGVVRIEADRVDTGWLFSIHSQGAPIEARQADEIFDPFQRGSHERRVSGSGLGLTICARIVKRLGGTIGVEPGETEGNVFGFVLPDPT